MSKAIRVVVADDSPFACRLIQSYLESASDFDVVGTAFDGRQAADQVRSLRPDVVALDLGMPEMDGLEAVERIMKECPTPVVVITGASGRSSTQTLQALDLGAVDYVLKFQPGSAVDPDLLAAEIVAKLRAASKVRVIRLLDAPVKPPPIRAGVKAAPQDGSSKPLVLIGASTGGPLALRELLSELPANFPAAVAIVQHMPPNFTNVLAAQLNRACAIQVREAEDGDYLRPGVALVAPGGFHMLISPGMKVSLRRGPAVGGHCPSVDLAMESAASALNQRVRGVLLTGMGQDGARGMECIRTRGGKTFAQDAASCVINGMPQKAIDRGAVDHVAPPAEIARRLVRELLGDKIT